MSTITIQYDNTDPDFAQLAEVVVEAMEAFHVPGVAVGLFHNGREYMAGFGSTSVENPLPITADTLFQIGSITKTFTATAIMRLVDRGQLDLNTPVKDLLPDFRLQEKDAEARVTIRHLLTHMGGWVGDLFLETGNGDDAVARYVAAMAQLPQIVPLDTLWSYNNAGFGLAGRIIEIITGMTYEAALQELILDPLQLEDSFIFPQDVMSRRFVAGHRYDDEEGLTVLRPWPITRSAYALGGLASCVRDQLTYARFHMGDGTTQGGEELLEAATLAAMQRPLVAANLDRKMGLSWFSREVGGKRLVQHGGATLGHEAVLVMAPEEQFAVVVLTNSDDGHRLYEIVIRWVLDHYLDVAEPEMQYLEMPVSKLVEYKGTYDALMTRLELSIDDDALWLQVIPQGGFPDKDSPISPPPPPTRVAFYDADRIVALDPPLRDTRLEFLREDDGRIAWLHTSRLHRKLAD